MKIIVGAPLYLLSKFFPKNAELSVIGSSLGKHFVDNPKYFFIDYYRVNPNMRNLVWISKNRNLVNELKSKGYPAELLYSGKGVFYCLRASKAYISHRLDDLDGALIGGAEIIQLWHGMPLRKIGFRGDWNDESISGKVKVYLTKFLPYSYYMMCDTLYAPSALAKNTYLEPFSKSFRNGSAEESIHIKGQARVRVFEDDFLLDKVNFPEVDYLSDLSERYNGIISWLPTQRTILDKNILDVISDSGMSFHEINVFCEERNFLFVIKAHFLDVDHLSNFSNGFKNILIYPYSDPYPLLKITEILVTDYSSVLFDFLFAKKPMVFICHDLETYRKRVDFYYEIDELNLGPICSNWSEGLSEIKEIISGEDSFSNLRRIGGQRFVNIY